MGFADSAVTRSGFLGGRVTVLQPKKGYRAGVDPVLLAASIPARSGETALELGCGVGVASLCLAARVPGLRIIGVELQSDYADLARQNAQANRCDFDVFTADLRHLPEDLRQQQVHHVFANPPYFERDRSSASQDAGKDIAMAGDTPLSDWVAVAAKRTRPKGTVTFIQRVERLPELLSAFQAHLGSLQVLPILPRPGRDSQLFLIRGRKNGRADFRLHAGIQMHAGDHHVEDGESYTGDISAVLRDGAALNFPA